LSTIFLARGRCPVRFSGRVLPVSAAVLSAAVYLAIPSVALSNVTIDNFGTINPKYYRGAQPKGRDYADLAALGVKTVIDLQEYGDNREPALVRAAGMKYERIPMTTHETVSPEKITKFLALVNDPKNQPVYVHCAGGRHRTGVMTAVYRMTQDRWTADQAFGEMKKFNYGPVFLHPEFKSFVYSYKPETSKVATLSEPAAIAKSGEPTAQATR
jgi:tyrosine-protein phosphatase SIW14